MAAVAPTGQAQEHRNPRLVKVQVPAVLPTSLGQAIDAVIEQCFAVIGSKYDRGVRAARPGVQGGQEREHQPIEHRDVCRVARPPEGPVAPDSQVSEPWRHHLAQVSEFFALVAFESSVRSEAWTGSKLLVVLLVAVVGSMGIHEMEI